MYIACFSLCLRHEQYFSFSAAKYILIKYTLTMANLRVSEWRRLPVSLTELCLDTTLRCGQSFRWKENDGKW
jgi:8-oxoguanine DNA glycosylase, N-terminal domain